MRLPILLLMLATSTVLRAQSPTWVKIGDVGSPASSSLVDTSSALREPFGLVVVRVMLVIRSGPLPGGYPEGTKYSITSYEVDCPHGRMRLGPGATYNARGNVLGTDPDPTYTDWVTPQPLSISQGVLSGICSILRL